ncbi:helix-turn-helix transcriptional regulator [Cohnella sp. GCM10027633]|uniref:helix-turn-helix transcriptional regulator n=1 Tax=unclassified Cohnella TaxID=2636738 RepID=UPI0036417B7B
MAMPKEEGSTRSRLLHLLRTGGSCAVNELAGALGITEMAVRKHLNAMEQDGHISVTAVRQTMGRPIYRYSLTEKADDLFPKNYSQLTLDLLAELEEDADGAAVIDRMFQGRRDKLAARYEERMKERPLEERVRELAVIQNGGGYMATWERTEDDGGYALHEYNCPIAHIADRFRQACHCEKQLFAQLLDADVERTECLAEGGGRCTYAIKPRHEAASAK